MTYGFNESDVDPESHVSAYPRDAIKSADHIFDETKQNIHPMVVGKTLGVVAHDLFAAKGEASSDIAFMQRVANMQLANSVTEKYALSSNGLQEEAVNYIEYICGEGAIDALGITKETVPPFIDALMELSGALNEDIDHGKLAGLLQLFLLGNLDKTTTSRYDIEFRDIKPYLRAFRIKTVREIHKSGLSFEDAQIAIKRHVVAAEYEPNEDLERMNRFLNEISREDISERLQIRYTDSKAVTAAIMAMNYPFDIRTRVDDFETAVRLACVGQTDEKIGEAIGTNRSSATQYLERMRKRTWKKIIENKLDPVATITTYVTSFREGQTDWLVDENGRPFVHVKSTVVRKINHVAEKSPLLMPKKIKGGTVHVVAQESLYEKYRNSTAKVEYPDDEECPEFTTMWGRRTLSLLYDMLQFEQATIIRERADGTDKTRKPTLEMTQALGRLARMARRAKTDFENDADKKMAFDMLTQLTNERFNTLGDICRAFKQKYPDCNDQDVAKVVMASITDVLRDYEKVLVIQHS